MQKKKFKTARDTGHAKKIDIQIFSLLRTLIETRK